MKHLWCTMAVCVFLALPMNGIAATGNTDGDLKEGLKTMVEDLVNKGQQILEGIDEGVEAGRKKSEAVDGAKIVSNKQELAAMLKISALKVENGGSETFEITLAVRNDNDFPVRMTNLGQPASVVLLDTEGFSYVLADPRSQGQDVTVLARSATRVRYTFSRVEGKPGALRLLDTDVPLR